MTTSDRRRPEIPYDFRIAITDGGASSTPGRPRMIRSVVVEIAYKFEVLVVQSCVPYAPYGAPQRSVDA